MARTGRAHQRVALTKIGIVIRFLGPLRSPTRASSFLIHRSRDNAIERTDIHFESGRVYIERPAWPTVHEKRFHSIEALFKALPPGMSLAGWSKPP